jgi:hypothetical protein
MHEYHLCFTFSQLYHKISLLSSVNVKWRKGDALPPRRANPYKCCQPLTARADIGWTAGKHDRVRRNKNGGFEVNVKAAIFV